MASAQYLVRGTPRLFADTAQTEDYTLTLSALGSLTGQVSALADQGAGAQPYLWEWQLHCQLTGTNVVGAIIEVYCFYSDGTLHDGLVTANAALATADKRLNGHLAGQLIVDQTTSNITMIAGGVLMIPTRYYLMCVFNGTTLPFKTDTGIHGLIMTPLYLEAQ